LYVHLVWSTWDRLSLIDADIEPRLYAAMAEKCREFKCEPLAVGGIADHVHLLVRLNPTTPVATLVKEIKGSSSHLVTHVIKPGEFFKGQGGYGAFTLRKSETTAVREYIENQKEHHTSGKLSRELERTFDEE